MKVFNNVIGGSGPNVNSKVIDVSNLNEITLRNDTKYNCISLEKGNASNSTSFVINLNVTAETILVFASPGPSVSLTINLNDGAKTLTVSASQTNVFHIVNYGNWYIQKLEPSAES